MVLAAEAEWIAAVVDAVLEVVPISASQLAPPPPLFHGLSAEFLRGILRRDDHLIIVLDVARLLSVKERLAYDRTQGMVAGESPVEQPMEGADAQPRVESVAPDRSDELAAPAADTLIITRSGDPLLNDPLQLPVTSEEPVRIGEQGTGPLDGPSTTDDGEDGTFRRSDG
jgi:hypothetical protein